jgi:Transglutaminase-like superfamily
MKKLLILLFFIKNTLFAQSVAEITQQITKDKTTDSAKIEAIYDWLTRHVDYDHKHRYRREGDTTLRQEPYNVVVLKKAVCIGYAKTFKEMCRLSGIEAVVIEGLPKNINGQVEREGHAWNAVKINNNWYLADATWDAGNTVSPKKYFLTDPSVFVGNHLPHDPMWQLLTEPIAFNCFTNNRPCSISTTHGNFNFSDTIRLWQSLDATQQLYNQSIRMHIFNPDDVWAMRGLADYYGQQATKTFDEYSKIRQAVTDKKRLPNGKLPVLKLLETATNYLKAAQAQYAKIATHAKKGEYTDAHLNAETIEETLENLTKEKEFVTRFFKN